MERTRQREALDAFEEALDWPPDERAARLAELARRRPGLATQVADYLAREDSARLSLPTEPPPRRDLGELDDDDAPLVKPERVGVYRLTELLGEGGMGAVWRGERDDGLFEQKVAVKLMRPGLLSPVAVSQFATERRVLARLRHPHIAQLFDGGSDLDGRAYFVMEEVDGVPLTDFARSCGLDLKGKAALVLPLCAAVAYAHQQLVVHADIKPGNVLVEADGRPKLLDFGIARNLAEADEEGGARGLTLAYAAPERRAGERATPAGDVYALGALLHELAAGAPPATAPPPPLTGVDPEFAAVVAKACAREPVKRYASAGALAEDLQRWLEGRPVAARPPSRRRAAWKFVRRRPQAVAAVVASVLGLVLALTTISILYVEAKAERALAEQRFADVRGVAKHLLFDLYDRLEQTPRSLSVRRDLAAVGQSYLARLTATPGAPADVQAEAAAGYLRLAVIQGGGMGRSLGDTRTAMADLGRALALAQAIPPGPKRAAAALITARARLEQASLAIDKDGEATVAETRLAQSREALAEARRLGAPATETATFEVEERLALAALRQWQSKNADSLREAQAAVALAQALGSGADARRLQARAWDAVAETTWYTGDEAGSAAPYRRELDLLVELHVQAPGDPSLTRALARAQWSLATVLIDTGKGVEALALVDEALALAHGVVAFDADDAQAARTLRILEMTRGQALAALKRYGEAEATLRQAVAARHAIAVTSRSAAEPWRDYAIGLISLADVYAADRKFAPACANYRQTLAVFADLKAHARLNGLDTDHPVRAAEHGVKVTCGG